MNAIDKLRRNGIEINIQQLTSIAQEFAILELSVFGSSIRSGSTSPNDVDLLVTFATDAEISLFDLMDLETKLETVFHLPVDIVEPQAITNPIRRKKILSTVERLYAA